MWSFILGLLSRFENPMALSVLGLICLNVVLTAAKKSLEKFMHRTATNVDDIAYSWVLRAQLLLWTALEFLTANSSALPKSVQDLLKDPDAQPGKPDSAPPAA